MDTCVTVVFRMRVSVVVEPSGSQTFVSACSQCYGEAANSGPGSAVTLLLGRSSRVGQVLSFDASAWILGTLGFWKYWRKSWRLFGCLLGAFLEDFHHLEQNVKIAKNLGKPIVFH